MQNRKAQYVIMQRALESALGDLAILAGDQVGPSDATWQDVAGTCAVNLEVLTMQLREARAGNAEPFLVFPSPAEAIEAEVAE